MTNEQYLLVSYFDIGFLSLGLGLATYLWLRLSFTGVTRDVPGRRLPQILRKLFSIGIVLPALAGFFSISFRSCTHETYDQIIADRAYLVAKNRMQVSTSLFHIVLALLAWGFIVFGVLLIIKRHWTAQSTPALGNVNYGR